METFFLDKIAPKKTKSSMLENADCVFFIVLSRHMNLFIRKKRITSLLRNVR